MNVQEIKSLKKGDLIRISSNVEKSIQLFGNPRNKKQTFAGTNQIIRKIESTKEKGPRILIDNPTTFSFCAEDILCVVTDIKFDIEEKSFLFDPVYLDI